MRLFKKILLILSGLLGLLILLLLIGVGVIFYRPTILLNPKNIETALNKTHIFEKWSWSEASINHEWLKWNERHLQGNVRNFCFLKKKPYSEIDACIDEATWDFVIRYEFKKGFSFIYKNPLTVNASKLNISTRKDPSNGNTPPKILAIWKLLWKPFIPDIFVNFQKIVITNFDNTKKKPIELKIEAQKIKDNLQASAYGFNLHATPERIVITGPEELRLPYDLKTRIPLSFKEIKLIAEMNKKKNIPISAEAKIATAAIKINSSINKESLEEDLGKPIFLKKIVTETSGTFIIEKVRETIKLLMRPPYNILPAPFNALEGYLNIKVKGENAEGTDVKANISSEFNMRSKTQAIHFILDSKIPFSLENKEVKGIDAELFIKRIALHLPQLARNRIPPQMLPDKRFKVPPKGVKTKRAMAKAKSKAPKEVDIKLQALGNDSFNLKTNLLDEILRLNFDLTINEKGVRTGYLSALPFRTTFFKRPINLKHMKITFNQPIIPQIVGQVIFDLPEYKITLDLEGPINQPRHAFKSVPPLPLDDIYSVLLFGQPLSSLEDTDKEDAQKTSELLSKGILSLAVLYYFAGTPVESIGYDPDTDMVTAQVGLGEKSSLHLTGEQGGLNSAGVRRSLGKGWYIDSSVQKSSGPNNDFGVLLERIISY